MSKKCKAFLKNSFINLSGATLMFFTGYGGLYLMDKLFTALGLQ